MKREKVQERKDKRSEKRKESKSELLIVVLSLIPLVFSGVFQGGYFLWETYLTFLFSVPAILLFTMMKFKANENRNPVRKSGVDLSLFVFIGICFLSLFFTVYFHATLTEFFKVLIYLALFYILLNTINGERETKIVIFSVLGLSTILSILGLVGYVGYKLNLTTSIFGFASRYSFTQAERIASTLQYSNTFAAFLIIPIFISFSGFISEVKLARKVIYLVLSLLFLLTFILTQSRGALVAFVVSVLIYLLLLKGKDRKYSLLTFGILVVSILVVVLVRKEVFLPVFRSLFERIKVMFSFFKGQWEESLGDRVYMLKDSLKILKDYPILGTGNGTYQYVYAKYRTIYFFSKFPHSIFFQVLDELGVLGGAAFVYMIFSLFRKGFKVIKENYSTILVGVYVGLLGMFLHALVDFDWSLMFMPLIFFYLFALVISQGKMEYFTFKCPVFRKLLKREKDEKISRIFDLEKIRTRRTRSLVIVLTTVLAVVFLFQFLADFVNFKAKWNMRENSPQNIVSMYETAIFLNPFSAEYHYNLANFNTNYLIPLASDPTKYVKQAEIEYLAAIRRCPMFFLYHFELGKLYLQTGNEKAIDEFTKTVQLNPLDPGARASLGLAYLNLRKDTSMSRIQFEKALELDPKNADAYVGLGSLFEQLGDFGKALENYQLAIKYSNNNAYAYYRAGVIYKNKGMIPEAVNNLFWAMHYNPNLKEARTEFEKYAPIIDVLKPQANEKVRIGSAIEIAWLPTNEKNIEHYNIWLVNEKGKHISIRRNVDKNEYLVKWEIPMDLAAGSYDIRVYAVNNSLMKNFGGWISFGEVNIEIIP